MAVPTTVIRTVRDALPTYRPATIRETIQPPFSAVPLTVQPLPSSRPSCRYWQTIQASVRRSSATVSMTVRRIAWSTIQSPSLRPLPRPSGRHPRRTVSRQDDDDAASLRRLRKSALRDGRAVSKKGVTTEPALIFAGSQIISAASSGPVAPARM